MKILSLVCLIILSTNAFSKREKELEFASLEKDYNNLIHNEKFKGFALQEKQSAKRSVEALINGQVKRKNRQEAVYMARYKIAYARLAAEEYWLKKEIEIEKDINLDLEIAISKAESTLSRRDAEVARMMLIAQQEEAQRANERAKQAEIEAQNRMQEAELFRQQTEAAKRYAQAQAEEASLAKQEAELAFEQANSLREKLNSISTEQTDKGLMMTLGDFVFDSGKSTIKSEAQSGFDKVIDFINTYPENKIRIEGHTDSSGSNELNLKLSQKRANAVKKILVQNGIDANLIEAEGMGEEFPIASNSSSKGKAKNRRVEIIILQ